MMNIADGFETARNGCAQPRFIFRDSNRVNFFEKELRAF